MGIAPVKEEILYFNEDEDEDEDALYEENVEEMQALRQKARVSEKGLFNNSAKSIMPDSLNTPDDCTHPFSIDYYEVK
ncbi:MAG: hypothetical protein K0U37_07030 [Gammaproteobacteria bacterium]|nr:hypothetical protein [Gammaproteobacteria bacterium]